MEISGRLGIILHLECCRIELPGNPVYPHHLVVIEMNLERKVSMIEGQITLTEAIKAPLICGGKGRYLKTGKQIISI